MEATSTGLNRTGAAMSPEGSRAMQAASLELTPPATVDLTEMKAMRMRSIAEADAVGSIPPPATLGGIVKTGLSMVTGNQPTLLLDKMGERLAFERTGTRLYDALITKYEALSATSELPTLDQLPATSAGKLTRATDRTPLAALKRIRAEEHAHFQLLSQAIESLGGDPTAQTPCADVAGAASIGFMQVLTDPRTTLAQCLDVMLGVELTDNAGWELLIQLAEDNAQSDLAGRFLGALAEEQEHAIIVRGWLESLLKERVGTPAV